MRRSISSSIFCLITSSIANSESRRCCFSVQGARRGKRRTGELSEFDEERDLRFYIVIDQYDEGVISGFGELQIVQRQDLVGRDGLARVALRNDFAAYFENRVAIRVVQPDLHGVRASVFGPVR